MAPGHGRNHPGRVTLGLVPCGPVKRLDDARVYATHATRPQNRSVISASRSTASSPTNRRSYCCYRYRDNRGRANRIKTTDRTPPMKTLLFRVQHPRTIRAGDFFQRACWNKRSRRRTVPLRVVFCGCWTYSVFRPRNTDNRYVGTFGSTLFRRTRSIRTRIVGWLSIESRARTRRE